MKFSEKILTVKVLMSLGLVLAAAYIVITALKWPLKTALFPIAIGIPVFCMAFAVFLLELFGKEKEKGHGGAQTMDFQLSKSEDEPLAMRRTIEMFLWILGWFFLILLVGFSLSIPIFFIASLRFKDKESWRLTIILTAIAWAFFYGLFIWVLNTPFADGWLQTGLQALGILD